MNYNYYKPTTAGCGTEQIMSGGMPAFEPKYKSKYNKLYSVEKVKPTRQFTPTQVARPLHTSSNASWPYPNNDWKDPRDFFKPFKSSSLTTSGNIRQVRIK